MYDMYMGTSQNQAPLKIHLYTIIYIYSQHLCYAPNSFGMIVGNLIFGERRFVRDMIDDPLWGFS